MSTINGPTVVYERPSGSTIKVADTEGNRQQAKALGWKEAAKKAKPTK